MNFNFGEVFTRAWQIVWKHKILWIFGIFAGCTQGGGGGTGAGGGGGGGSGSDGPVSPEIQRAFENFGQWLSENTWIVVLVGLALVALWILCVFLGTIGRIGLIRGTVQAEAGAESLLFGELFSGSLPYFWRVFGLALLIGLVFVVVFVPIVLLGVLTAGVAFLCLIPLICILVPIVWVVAVLIEQANVAIVTEDLGVFDGLRRGWEVVMANPGAIIVMALGLLVLSGVIGLIAALPVFILVLPAFVALAIGEGQSAAPLMVAGLCFLAYLPVLIVVHGIQTAYIESAWALTYLRLARPKESAPALQPNA